MGELQIDPMSAASPELTPAEFGRLRESIAKLGQLVPIVLYRGKVLDGRKRLVVCAALGIEPKTVAIPDDVTSSEYAEALNLLRTHYTAAQRAMYAAKLATWQKAWNLRGRPELLIKSSGITVAQAATVFGVPESTVHTAKRLRRLGTPEVAAAVEGGHLSLDSARRIVETTPKPEQATRVAKVVALKGTRRRLPAGTIRSGAGHRALPRRDAAVVIGRSLQSILTHCEVLEHYETKALPNEASRHGWLSTLHRITTTLRRFRRRLKEDRHEVTRRRNDRG